MIISLASIYSLASSCFKRAGLLSNVENSWLSSASTSRSVAHKIARSICPEESCLYRRDWQQPMKTCLQSDLGQCLNCPYCDWVESGANLNEVERACSIRIEAARLLRIYDRRAIKSDKVNVPKLFPAGAFLKRRKVDNEPTQLEKSGPAEKLYKFLRLLRHMEQAPWANIQFGVNQGMKATTKLVILKSKAHS